VEEAGKTREAGKATSLAVEAAKDAVQVMSSGLIIRQRRIRKSGCALAIKARGDGQPVFVQGRK
jgi:hypothetical protein